MRIKIPLQIVELESENYHLIVEGTFEDGTIINWIVDTGASKSVFDSNISVRYQQLDEKTEEIHSAGIGENPLETSIGELESFFLGKLKINTPKMAILDLSHINKLYSTATNLKIAGLIGGDFLKKYQAKIDYKKKVLELKK